ncbi:MAG: Lrp/AsnC family transcriptional regulator [Nocardioidaceae bacterium]
MALDEADLALLEELRGDGRASYERLGSLVGLSRTAARARVHRMLESGSVRVEAVAHPGVYGYFTFSHVSVTLDGASAQTVAASIARMDHAPLVSIVAGRASLIAELRTRDLGEMEHAIDGIRAIDGVVALDVVLYTDVVKDSHLPLGGPHSFEEFHIDDTDRRILDLLMDDARMPYADLAADIGLSRAATRARVLRLLRDGVVVVKGMVNPTAVGINQMCGFEVTMSDVSEDVTGVVANLDAVDFLARTIGRCDLIGTLIARGRSDVREALDEVRALEGVRRVEAWWHLELVKERYSPRTP